MDPKICLPIFERALTEALSIQKGANSKGCLLSGETTDIVIRPARICKMKRVSRCFGDTLFMFPTVIIFEPTPAKSG